MSQRRRDRKGPGQGAPKRSLRILLDECLPKRLKSSLTGHVCMSVVDFGYLPGRNKESLLLFGEGIFDVFITFDVPTPDRRKLIGHRTSVITLSAKSNRLEDLKPLVGGVLAALNTIEPGQVVHVTSKK